jgi:hypothetical protein
MSGSQADEIIRQLEEFGPEYFENTETVRISPDTYRLVAPFIKDKALCVDGQALELNSANVQKVARTVRESQRALPAPADDPSLSCRLGALHRHAMGVAAEFREVARECRKSEDASMFQSMFRSTLVLACCELPVHPQQPGATSRMTRCGCISRTSVHAPSHATSMVRGLREWKLAAEAITSTRIASPARMKPRNSSASARVASLKRPARAWPNPPPAAGRLWPGAIGAGL